MSPPTPVTSSLSSDGEENGEGRFRSAQATDGDHESPSSAVHHNRNQPEQSPLDVCDATGRHRRQRTHSYTERVTTDDSLPIYRVPGASRRTIYTAGRPPWYHTDGQKVEPFIIGICGGTASGKTSVARRIIEALDMQWVTLVSMDSFYKVLSAEQHDLASRNEYNFDHPDAFDFDLMFHVLQRLKVGKKADIPVYNFVTHKREPTVKTVYGANVVIFEGILAFYSKQVLDVIDTKVFVDTDSDERLARRLLRDTQSRGRTVDGVLQQYERFVKPAFDHYIAPSMAHADIIVPRGGENSVAINLIVQLVTTQLQQRGLRVRDKLIRCGVTSGDGVSSRTSSASSCWPQSLRQPHPDTLYVLANTPQVRGLHTFIRDASVSRDVFVFYSRRLMRLTLERAVSLLAFDDITVDTPQGDSYQGRRLSNRRVCGVSILRAGEAMEQALTEVCQNASIGKMLIQTNRRTEEPELYYLRLPRDIKDSAVLLLDATVATGAAAMMALRVLLDHDVPEERIIMCSLLMAASGVHNIAYAFPRVRIVTSAVDAEVNDKFYVIPGIGNFGDRFFGTEAVSH